MIAGLVHKQSVHKQPVWRFCRQCIICDAIDAPVIDQFACLENHQCAHMQPIIKLFDAICEAGLLQSLQWIQNFKIFCIEQNALPFSSQNVTLQSLVKLNRASKIINEVY